MRRSARAAAPAPAITLARLTQGLRLTTALCSVFVLPVLSTTTAWALPQGGVVETGKAKIITKPTKVIIIQKTPSVVVDWNSFNVGAGEKVVVKQAAPTWTELNRVTGGGGASVINGKVNALGTVAISNPSGITFGPAAKVTVGSLIATSANIRSQDFTAGNYNFNIAGHPDAAVINQGTITVAQGGLAALVAPGVQNSGVINAHLGKVALAAGNGFAVDLHGDRLINFAVDFKVSRPPGAPTASRWPPRSRTAARSGPTAAWCRSPPTRRAASSPTPSTCRASCRRSRWRCRTARSCSTAAPAAACR